MNANTNDVQKVYQTSIWNLASSLA